MREVEQDVGTLASGRAGHQARRFAAARPNASASGQTGERTGTQTWQTASAPLGGATAALAEAQSGYAQELQAQVQAGNMTQLEASSVAGGAEQDRQEHEAEMQKSEYGYTSALSLQESQQPSRR